MVEPRPREGSLPPGISTVGDLQRRLRDSGYLADEGLATSIFLSLRLAQPLFLEGEAGVGKTEVANALARLYEGELIRLQCYEGIEASQAVYEWSYIRQIIRLRTQEARGELPEDADLFSLEYLIKRPLLQAIMRPPSSPQAILLIDEVDRADDEFEAFLLEVLADFAITVPELGTFRAHHPPVVVVTSNRTREVHDALKRRCLYHWVDHPDYAREVAILRLRIPHLEERLAAEVTAVVQEIRTLPLYKPPGVAETLGWARALRVLGAHTVEAADAAATLGTLLKHREDQEQIRAQGLTALVDRALRRDT